MDLPTFLSDRHRQALQWFADRAGDEVAWPEPLDGLFLVNKAKGIHKPQGFEHALSIRQSLDGPYEDFVEVAQDGSWVIRYAFEGTDPEHFTNAAMIRCHRDGVPVGVVLQTKKKPNPLYRVMGLGSVAEVGAASFTILPFGSAADRADSAAAASAATTDFEADSSKDARKKVLRSIAQRRGQPRFRRDLMQAYGGRCAVTGCAVAPILEAAHILPYKGDHTNHIQNGLLLRTDIHTLFDLKLLWIDAGTMAVRLDPRLEGTDYWALSGKQIHLPVDRANWPSSEALALAAAENSD